MARLLDPKNDRGEFPFAYTPSAKTDVARTFARARKEQKAAEQARQEQKASAKVSPLKRGGT